MRPFLIPCNALARPAELAPDGKPVFKGPRVAMAVHQSAEWTAVSVPRQQAAADDVTTDYLGTAVERVQQLRWRQGAGGEDAGSGQALRGAAVPSCSLASLIVTRCAGQPPPSRSAARRRTAAR